VPPTLNVNQLGPNETGTYKYGVTARVRYELLVHSNDSCVPLVGGCCAASECAEWFGEIRDRELEWGCQAGMCLQVASSCPYEPLNIGRIIVLLIIPGALLLAELIAFTCCRRSGGRLLMIDCTWGSFGSAETLVKLGPLLLHKNAFRTIVMLNLLLPVGAHLWTAIAAPDRCASTQGSVGQQPAEYIFAIGLVMAALGMWALRYARSSALLSSSPSWRGGGSDATAEAFKEHVWIDVLVATNVAQIAPLLVVLFFGPGHSWLDYLILLQQGLALRWLPFALLAAPCMLLVPPLPHSRPFYSGLFELLYTHQWRGNATYFDLDHEAIGKEGYNRRRPGWYRTTAGVGQSRESRSGRQSRAVHAAGPSPLHAPPPPGETLMVLSLARARVSNEPGLHRAMAAHLAREQEHVTHANPCCPTRPFHCCARWIVVQSTPDYVVPMLAPPPFLPIEIEEPVVILPAVRVHVQPLSPFPPAVFSTPLAAARPYPQPQLVEELVLRPATTLPHSIDSGASAVAAVRSTPAGHAAVRLPPLASSSSSGMAAPNFLNPSITGASRFFSALDLPDKAAELTREMPRTPSPARMAVADAQLQQADNNKRFFGSDLTIPAAGGDRARPQLSPQARVFKAALYDLEIPEQHPSSVRVSPQRSPVRFANDLPEHRPAGPSRTSTRPSHAAPPSSAGGADSDTDVELDADLEPSMGALPTLDEPVERPFDHDPAQQQHRPQQQQAAPPQTAAATASSLPSVAPIIVQPHKKRRMSAIEREQAQRAAGVPMLAAAPPPKPSSVATSPQASRPVSPAAAPRPAPRSPASSPSSSSQQQRPSSPFARWQVQVETPGVAAAPSAAGAVPAAALSSPFESLEPTIAAHGPFAGSPLAAQGAHWEPPPPATHEELFPPAQPRPQSPHRQQSAPGDADVANDAAAMQVRPALEFEPGLAPLPNSFSAPDE
jgi:hypothetical protein